MRRTFIRNVPGGQLLAEVLTEWAWIRLTDGRPARVPAELVEAAGQVTAATLAARRDRRPGAIA